ncbi:MAG: GNAT family N-acetyltransferase [Actinomycetota bacterium]
MELRLATTVELGLDRTAAIRAMLVGAWAAKENAFTSTDWLSATGGTHLWLEDDDGTIVSHASVVDRVLETGGRALATGYVEAVATAPAYRLQGHASAVMRAVGELLDERDELGALDTGDLGFYARFGWVLWEGPTMVRTGRGVIGTPEEDGAVMVRMTPRTPELDLTAPISCDWRPGDVW